MKTMRFLIIHFIHQHLQTERKLHKIPASCVVCSSQEHTYPIKININHMKSTHQITLNSRSGPRPFKTSFNITLKKRCNDFSYTESVSVGQNKVLLLGFSFEGFQNEPEDVYPFYAFFSKKYQFEPVVRMVLEYLPDKILIDVMANLSRHLREIVQKMEFGETMEFGKDDFTRLRRIGLFKIRKTRILWSSFPDHLELERSLNLEKLEVINEVKNFNESNLSKIGENYPNLKELILVCNMISVNGKDCENISLRNLELILLVTNIGEIKDVIQLIMKNSPKLHTIVSNKFKTPSIPIEFRTPKTPIFDIDYSYEFPLTKSNRTFLLKDRFNNVFYVSLEDRSKYRSDYDLARVQIITLNGTKDFLLNLKFEIPEYGVVRTLKNTDCRALPIGSYIGGFSKLDISENEVKPFKVTFTYKKRKVQKQEILEEGKTYLSKEFVIKKKDFEQDWEGNLLMDNEFFTCDGRNWMYSLMYYKSSGNFAFYLYKMKKPDPTEVLLIDFIFRLNKYADEFNDNIYKCGSGYGKISFFDEFVDGNMPLSILIKIKKVYTKDAYNEMVTQERNNFLEKIKKVEFGKYVEKIISVKRDTDNEIFKKRVVDFEIQGIKFQFDFIEKANANEMSKMYIAGSSLISAIIRIKIIIKILNAKGEPEYETPKIIYNGGYSTGFGCVRLPEILSEKEIKFSVKILIDNYWPDRNSFKQYFLQLRMKEKSKKEDTHEFVLKTKNATSAVHSENFVLCGLPHYVFFYPQGRNLDSKMVSFNVFNDLSRSFSDFKAMYTVTLYKRDGTSVTKTAEMNTNRTIPFYKFCEIDEEYDWKMKVKVNIIKDLF